MKVGKKRLPRVGDNVKIKDGAECGGLTGKIIGHLKGDNEPWEVQFGDQYDDWTCYYRRKDFLLLVPCLGHPLTHIFE